MSRKTATSASRCRHDRRPGPQQMDLFRSGPAGRRRRAPPWPELPEEARAALTSLMTQLILEHAGKLRRLRAKEASHDL